MPTPTAATYGYPWSGLPDNFFASTYTCGLGVAPGNLTSSPFRVNPKAPFLNFRLISPEDSLIYVEILQVYQNASQLTATPSIIAQFDTLNISEGAQISTQFANVSIPLTTLAGKVVEIRIVSDTLQTNRYVAVSDFRMESLADQDGWVTSSLQILK